MISQFTCNLIRIKNNISFSNRYGRSAIRNMVDAGTRKSLSGIPLLQTKAGPRDKEIWVQRLKEEYKALIMVCFSYLMYSLLN